MVLERRTPAVITIFFIASSMYFSNLIGEKGKVGGVIPISTVFTLLAMLSSLPLISVKYILSTILVSGIVFINFSLELGINQELALIIIKFLTFVTAWITLDHISLKDTYRTVLAAFLLSNLCALSFIILGLNEFRQILYPGFPPRYAAMAIEPAGFSLATLSLIYLYYLSRERSSSIIMTIYYLPFVLAISSAVLVKVVVDFARQLSLKLVSVVISISLAGLGVVVLLTTRASLSITTRLEIYAREIQFVQWTILGEGYAIEKYAALPGIIKFPAECGIIFSACIFTSLILISVKHRSYTNLTIFPIFFTPFITETYGAVLLWLPILCIIKKKKYDSP